MKKFPNELSDLFSAKGHKLVQRAEQLLVPGTQFAAVPSVLDEARCKAALALLDDKLLPHLQPLEQWIPPDALYGMTKNYSEQLPKVMRCKTAYLEKRRERAFAVADELNLTTMLKSQSFFQLAQTLSGQRLRKKFGQQVVCYEKHDYQGPHNDHHPEEPLAKDGYVDVHFSLASAGARQSLVYARHGHLNQPVEVARNGLLTVYRLPVWHYTTPLLSSRSNARRWVLLGTFLFA